MMLEVDEVTRPSRYACRTAEIFELSAKKRQSCIVEIFVFAKLTSRHRVCARTSSTWLKRLVRRVVYIEVPGKQDIFIVNVRAASRDSVYVLTSVFVDTTSNGSDWRISSSRDQVYRSL